MADGGAAATPAAAAPVAAAPHGDVAATEKAPRHELLPGLGVYALESVDWVLVSCLRRRMRDVLQLPTGTLIRLPQVSKVLTGDPDHIAIRKNFVDLARRKYYRKCMGAAKARRAKAAKSLLGTPPPTDKDKEKETSNNPLAGPSFQPPSIEPLPLFEPRRASVPSLPPLSVAQRPAAHPRQPAHLDFVSIRPYEPVPHDSALALLPSPKPVPALPNPHTHPRALGRPHVTAPLAAQPTPILPASSNTADTPLVQPNPLAPPPPHPSTPLAVLPHPVPARLLPATHPGSARPDHHAATAPGRGGAAQVFSAPTTTAVAGGGTPAVGPADGPAQVAVSAVAGVSGRRGPAPSTAVRAGAAAAVQGGAQRRLRSLAPSGAAERQPGNSREDGRGSRAGAQQEVPMAINSAVRKHAIKRLRQEVEEELGADAESARQNARAAGTPANRPAASEEAAKDTTVSTRPVRRIPRISSHFLPPREPLLGSGGVRETGPSSLQSTAIASCSPGRPKPDSKDNAERSFSSISQRETNPSAPDPQTIPASSPAAGNPGPAINSNAHRTGTPEAPMAVVPVHQTQTSSDPVPQPQPATTQVPPSQVQMNSVHLQQEQAQQQAVLETQPVPSHAQFHHPTQSPPQMHANPGPHMPIQHQHQAQVQSQRPQYSQMQPQTQRQTQPQPQPQPQPRPQAPMMTSQVPLRTSASNSGDGTALHKRPDQSVTPYDNGAASCLMSPTELVYSQGPNLGEQPHPHGAQQQHSQTTPPVQPFRPTQTQAPHVQPQPSQQGIQSGLAAANSAPLFPLPNPVEPSVTSYGENVGSRIASSPAEAPQVAYNQGPGIAEYHRPMAHQAVGYHSTAYPYQSVAGPGPHPPQYQYPSWDADVNQIHNYATPPGHRVDQGFASSVPMHPVTSSCAPDAQPAYRPTEYQQPPKVGMTTLPSPHLMLSNTRSGLTYPTRTVPQQETVYTPGYPQNPVPHVVDSRVTQPSPSDYWRSSERPTWNPVTTQHGVYPDSGPLPGANDGAGAEGRGTMDIGASAGVDRSSVFDYMSSHGRDGLSLPSMTRNQPS